MKERKIGKSGIGYAKKYPRPTRIYYQTGRIYTFYSLPDIATQRYFPEVPGHVQRWAAV
jgi:hypothetical protein